MRFNFFKKIMDIREPKPGELWAIDYDNPFEPEQVAKIVAVKKNWVQYIYNDFPDMKPKARKISNFISIYKLCPPTSPLQS